jgi:glucokinase
MRQTVGVAVSDRIVAGLVEDNRLTGALRVFPEPGSGVEDELHGKPGDEIVTCIRQLIEGVTGGLAVDAIGIGFPGIIRSGVVEESPNLRQMKGAPLKDILTNSLREAGINAPVTVYNDADIMAAGIAATRGQLDRLIRVWTLGNGVGYGRFPWAEGIWEGGHIVISLDPKEKYCGCGGVGHLEGIVGHRAMRLRFLDLEPEEVFENAAQGDARCAEFLRLWHRALAAATATLIHLDGPGKFFITGPNAKHLDLTLLNQHLHDMVKMSPLQGSFLEVVTGSDEIALIGAAVNAERAAFPPAP